MKRIIGLISFLVTMFLLGTFNIYASPSINTSNSSKGYVTVKGSSGMVAQISKSNQKYNYTLTDSKETNLPLQLGSGTYKILLLKKVSANQYSVSKSSSINVTDSGNNVYINSIQLVNFDKDMASIKALTNVISSGTTDSAKTKLLYEYMLDNFSYDFDKAKQLATATSYLPVIDNTYSTKKGICYDISSLFAAVLRYNDIPTKLIMGYTPNVSTYHAWNEVYYDKKWNTIDATYDIGVKKANKQVTMVKSNSDYKVTKAY